jgi:hypothetical protein
MTRILGGVVLLALFVLLALPFAREAYWRYEVSQNLTGVMNSRDQAAFENWDGSAISFDRSLLGRCELTNGPGSAACQRYRVAAR